MDPDISKVLKKFEHLPRFEDGRINYSSSSIAPVVTVFVQHGNELLLLKRSNKVSSYQGKWNNVGGYLDDHKQLREKALEELKEELGISEHEVASLHFAEPEILEDNTIGKTWIKYSGIAVLHTKPEIHLDFEHTDYQWVRPDDMQKFDAVPGLVQTWRHLHTQRRPLYELWVKVCNWKIKFLYKYILKQIFFLGDPEKVHDAMTSMGTFLGSFAFGKWLSRFMFFYDHPALRQTISGLHFRNPIGLAAGFDKNAELTQVLPYVGFGFEEVGSVTGEYCEGNAKPRLWRLKQSKSLLVYYGLKNDGAERISSKLQGIGFKFPVGISVAKTNNKETADDETGIADYVKAYRLFVEKKVGDYFTINISCPNAFGGEPFTTPEKFGRLMAALRHIQSPKPVFIKMPAEMPFEVLDGMIEVARTYKVTGFICTNLAKDRSNERIKDVGFPAVGGMSGKVVQELSDKQIAYIYKKTRGEFVIIGCGGVFNAEDAYKKIKLGASLIQIITGMIFEGPQVISEINQGLVTLLQQDGYANISEAVGSGVKE